MNGICLASCFDTSASPDPKIYSVDYDNYTCVPTTWYNSAIVSANPSICDTTQASNSSYDNLRVTIMDIGYTRYVPQDDAFYLVMNIENFRGSITNYTWK